MTAYQPSILNTLSPVLPARTEPAPTSAPVGSRNGEPAFNTHLQNAHRRQASASPSEHADADSARQASGCGNAAKTTAAASTTTVDCASGNSAKPDDDADTTDAGSTTSLASTVLGLIDQSSSDTSGVVDPTSVQARSAKQPVADPAAAAQAPVPMAPMLAAAIAVPAVNADAALASNAGTPLSNATTPGTAAITGAATAAATTPSAGSASDLLSGSDATGDNDGAAADGSNAATSFAAVSGSLLGLGLASAAQAAVGTLFGTGSVAGGTASNTGDTATRIGDDLAALGGVLGAGAVSPAINTNAANAHSLTVNAPVNSPAFSQELGQQVAWLGGQDIKQAQIRLHPQDMGPLNVTVSITHGKVDVVFLAQHPNAVAAVQQSLDQLGQMLNSQGLSLGQATVGQQGAQQQSGSSSSSGTTARTGRGDDEATDAAVAPLAQATALGLVDAFA